MRSVKIFLAILVFIIIAWGGLRLMASRARPPIPLGLHVGKLAPCPDSPNCVSSYETSPEHGIAPLDFDGDPQAALLRLDSVVSAMPGAHLERSAENYRHYTFRSKLAGYIDDVEFYFDGEVIQVRSASRSGYSDLGANRKRVERIRQAFLALP